MDYGQHVLTHEHQHVAYADHNLGLIGQDEEGRLPVVGRCGMDTCDGNLGCLCVDKAQQKPSIPRQSGLSSDSHLQRLKNFTFQTHHPYLETETRRYSSVASPRTRPSPMFLPFLPMTESFSGLHESQQARNQVDNPIRRRSTPLRSTTHPRQSHSWPPATATTPPRADFGVTPLLTPPEDLDHFTWTTCTSASTPSRQESLSSDIDNQSTIIPARHSSDRSTERPSTITLPAQGISQGEGGPTTWLSRAIQTIGEICCQRRGA
jgi:hypothetical protein